MKLIYILSFISVVKSLPEQGKWTLETDKKHEFVGISKSLFAGSKINMKVKCDSNETTPPLISINWVLRKTPCSKEMYTIASQNIEWLEEIFFNPKLAFNNSEGVVQYAASMKVPAGDHECNHNIILNFVDAERSLLTKSDSDAAKSQEKEKTIINKENNVDTTVAMAESSQAATSLDSNNRKKRQAMPTQGSQNGVLAKENMSPEGSPKTGHTVAIAPADGIYILIIETHSVSQYKTTIDVEMKSDYGYLSAIDYPLLTFFSVMCVIYVFYGLVWLIVCFMKWRELLRVQYWIGAVIFLGMLEKAMFTAEYTSINQQGTSVKGLIIAAELVSCAKRTLARILVIIVSLGFGIVKPRLGIILHRVIGLGLVYFILASIERCSNVLNPSPETKESLLTAVPLALLDAAICWWVFTALVQTMRTLRLRRNAVKLSVFQHFINLLAFTVLGSIVFRLYVIRYQEAVICLSDWKEIWIKQAFWHINFALILGAIMILWRPTNNNQRFAFSPLLDDGDDEESEKFLTEFRESTKQRNKSTSSSPRECNSVEDDLKWVEENLPSSLAETAIPILDSDEEILTTKFEISKMQ